MERTSLLFTHDIGEKTENGDSSRAIALLRILCESTVNDVRQSTPGVFSQLVNELKFLDKRSLDQVYNMVHRRNFCPNNERRVKKFYLDAIPLVGSSAAIEQITDRIISNEVTSQFVDAWLTSLAFVQKPTTGMLDTTKRLLQLPNSEKMIMPVSALVSTFCKFHIDCFSVTEVQDIISILENNIGNDCSTTNTNYMRVLMSLRAIGNIGYRQSIRNVLGLCISQQENEMEITLTAIEAFRKIPCSVNRDELLQLLQNKDKDAEIRIAGYLQLMKCPSASVIDEVLRVLSTEQVQQVGSFLWTHLTNLQETSDPLKQDVRAMLENINIEKVFDLDKRKFSRNYEFSHFSEKYNLVGTVDGNLIWSPKSFVPRSIMLNLTAGVFGYSFNLLEVGGRAVGTADLLEKYFGPSGIFNKDRAQAPAPPETSSNLLNMAKLNRIDERMRVAREEFEASIYVRVFGNEVKYFNTRQLDSISRQNLMPDDFSNMLRELSRNGEVSYTYSSMFLDSSLIIPTSVGLPLNLTLNSTLSTDLKIIRNVDVADPRRRVLLEGNIQPSAALEIDSMISIDANVVRSGMKMLSTLHTSTAIRGKVQLNENQAFELELDYPKQTSEIISISNSLYFVEGDEFSEHTIPNDALVNIDLCSGNTIAKVTGLELCGQVRMPNTSLSSTSPRWPLLGPVNISVSLSKRDLPGGYKIQYQNTNNPRKTEFQMSFDTPNSRTSRRIGVNLDVNHRQMTMLLEFLSPWKNARLTGNLFNDNRLKGMEGYLHIDGNRRMGVVTKVRIIDRGNTLQMVPQFEIFDGRYININISGSIDYKHGKYVKLNLEGREDIFREDNDQIILKGDILFPDDRKVVKIEYSHKSGEKYKIDGSHLTRTKSNGDSKHQTNLNILSPEKTVLQATSSVNVKDGLVGYSIKINKITKVPLTFKGRYRKRTLKNSREMHLVQFRYRGPKKTDLAVRINMDKRPVGMQIATSLNYNFLKLIDNAKDAMTFSSKTVWDKKNYGNLRINTNFKSSSFGDYNHKISAKTTFKPKKYLSVILDLDHGKKYMHKDNKKRVSLKVDSDYNIRNLKNARVKYNIRYLYPIQRSKFTLLGEHSHTPLELNSSITILNNKDKLCDAAVLLSDKRTRNRLQYEGAASLNIQGWPYIKVNADVSQPNENEIIATFSEQHERKRVNTLNVNYKTFESSKELSTSLQLYDKRQITTGVYYNHPRTTAHEINTNFGWHDGTSFSSEVSVDVNSTSPQATLSFSFGQNNYSMSLSGANEREYRSVSTDVRYPSRHIAVEIGIGKRQNTYQFITDLQWDVHHQPNSRVMLELTYRNQGYHDFRSSVKVQFLHKVYGALVEHVNRGKYVTRAEVQWARDKKVGAEFELQQNHGEGFRNFVGVVGIMTPFDHLDKTRLAVHYDDNFSKISSVLNFTFDGGKVFAIGFEGKKPMTFYIMDLKLLLELPSDENKKSTLHIQHNLSENIDQHTGKAMLSWDNNQQFLNIETFGTAQNGPFNYHGMDYIAITSSIRELEDVKLNISFNSNQNQFASYAVYNQNGDIYLYNVEMDWNQNGAQLQSHGTFNITSARDYLHMTWSHENTDHSIDTITTMRWKNGHMFQASLNGNLQTSPTTEVTGTFRALIPSNEIRNIEATIRHNHRVGNIQSLASLLVDGQNYGSLSLDYGRRLRNADSRFSLTSRFLKNDFSVRMESDFGLPSKRNELEIQWTPQKKIRMVSNYKTNLGSPNSELELTITSPFQQARRIHITGERNMQNFVMNNIINIEFAPRQSISIEGQLNFVRCCNIENFVLPRVKVSTPFPQMSYLDIGISWNGNLNEFRTSTYLEIVPHVPRHEVNVDWLLSDEIRGSLNVSNPNFSYLLAQIKSNAIGNSRSSELKLMYIHNRQPKNIKILSNVIMSKDNMDGEVVVTNSFTHPITIKYKHNTDITAFINHAHVSYSRNKNVTVDLEFGNIDGLYGLLKLHTPYRGTEEVELGFHHHGNKVNEFTTTAYYGANNKRIEIIAGVDFVDKTECNVQLITPFKAIRLAKISFSADDLYNHRSSIEFATRTNKIQAESSLQHIESETLFISKLETPWEAIQSAEFTARTEINPRSFALLLQSKRNSDNIDATVTLSHNKKSTSLVSELKSNLFEDISITVAKEGRYFTDTRGQFIGMVGDKKIESSVMVTENENGYDLNWLIKRLNIPFLKNVEASVNIIGKELKNHSSRTSIRYGEKHLEIEQSFFKGSNIPRMEGRLIIDGNFEIYGETVFPIKIYSNFTEANRYESLFEVDIGNGNILLTENWLLSLNEHGFIYTVTQTIETVSPPKRYHYDVEIEANKGDFYLKTNASLDKDTASLMFTMRSFEEVDLNAYINCSHSMFCESAQFLLHFINDHSTSTKRGSVKIFLHDSEILDIDANLDNTGNYSIHIREKLLTADSDVRLRVLLIPAGLGSSFVALDGNIGRHNFENSLDVAFENQKLRSKLRMINNLQMIDNLIIDLVGKASETSVEIEYGTRRYFIKAVHIYRRNNLEISTDIRGHGINDFQFILSHKTRVDGHSFNINSRYGSTHQVEYENEANIRRNDILIGHKLNIIWDTNRYRSVFSYRLNDCNHNLAALVTSGDKSIKAKVNAELLAWSDIRMKGDLLLDHNGRKKHEFEMTSLLAQNLLQQNVKLNVEDILTVELFVNASSLKSVNIQLKYTQLSNENQEMNLNLEGGLNSLLEGATYNGHFHLLGSNGIHVGVDANAELIQDESSARLLSNLEVRGTDDVPLVDVKYDGRMNSDNTILDQLQIQFNSQMYYEHAVDVRVHRNVPIITLNFKSANMECEVNTQFEGRSTYVVNGMLNWNKDRNNAIIRINGRAVGIDDVDERRFVLTASYPSRTLKVECRLTRGALLLVPNDFIIDINHPSRQRFGYTSEWPTTTNWSSSLKIITPLRSVQLEFDKTNEQPTVNLKIYLDADNDREKRAEIILSGNYNNPSLHISSVSLTLPIGERTKTFSIRHESIKTVTDEGFNGRTSTEIMYSNDQSKKMVFLTDWKLDYRSSYNNTLLFSVTQRHTRTDLSANMHIANIVNGRSSMGIVVHNNNRNYQMMAVVDKAEKSAQFYTINPRGAVGIKQMYSGRNPSEIRVMGMFDLENKIDVKVTVDEERRKVHWEFKYDPEYPVRTLHLVAEYPDNVNFNMEIYRTGDFPRVSEAKIEAQLRSSRQLYTKIDWRPQAVVDVVEYNAEMIRHHGGLISNHVQQSLNLIGRDTHEKYSAFMSDFDAEFVPLSQELTEELEAVNEMITSLRRRIRRMHRNNELYLRDITEAMEVQLNNKLSMIQHHVAAAKEHYNIMHNRLQEFSNEIQSYPIRQTYEDLAQRSQERIEQWKTQMYELLNNQGTVFKERLEEQLEIIVQLIGNGTDVLSSVLQSFLTRFEVDLQNLSSVLQETPYLSSLSDIGEILLESVNSLKNSISEVSVNNLDQMGITIQREVLAQFDDVLQNPNFRRLSRVLSDITSELRWVMDELDVSLDLYNLTSDLVNSTEDFIRNDIGRLQILNLHRNRILVFDPENGHIEIELYLPSPVTSIQRLPSIHLKKYLDRIDRIAKKLYYLATDFSLWDLYYKYRIFTSPSMWIPPFRGVATVGSSRHFVTFDGHHFDFAGMCSYILVQDVADDNFTVIINYNRNRQSPKIRSLLVLVEGQAIEIRDDYKIRVNNRPHELPYIYGELQVTRKGNHVLLDSGRGLIIEENLEHDILMVAISGFYQNKVAGLLGSFDNEPYNDIMTSTGQLTTDLNNYGDSWEVNRRCKSGENIIDQPTDEGIENVNGYQHCAALFKEKSSPFRPCFKQVKPDVYLHMCVHNMRAGEREPCKIASLYTMRCREEGVSLWMPEQCIMCQSPNNEQFMAGEMIKLSHSTGDYNVPQSADVVFVVEGKQCVRSTANHLGSLVYEVENMLKLRAIESNRYGLMSFNENGSFSHTFQGEIFNDAKEFAKGLESLVFGGDTTDVHEAIMTAANYPFRTGVSKTIVLVQCSSCGDPSYNVMVSYLKHLLNTRDITLHILRNQILHVDDNKSTPTLVTGIDKSKVYTVQESKASNLDVSMIMTPDDSCASLALYSNGSIFDTSSLGSSTMRARNMYSRLVGRRIAETAQPHQCQVCQCLADETGAAKSICRKCMNDLSELIPQIWTPLKHPQQILDEFENEFQEYIQDVRSI